MKAPLILRVSTSMTSNKKKDRGEDKLIRIGSRARKNLGLEKAKEVELWPQNGGSQGRIHRARLLKIHEAFSRDLKDAKERMPEEDFLRVGFVTMRTFRYICGRDPGADNDTDNIWLADELQDIAIGADPEFLLGIDESRKRFKYAGNVHNFSHTAKLGSDGPWAELRPDPEIEVEKLVDNMRGLFKNSPNAKNTIRGYYWLGGCFYEGEDVDRGDSRGWPIGGHVHVGSPIRLLEKIDKLTEEYGGQRQEFIKELYFSCLKHVLDEMVAVPLLKLDGVEDGARRRQQFGGVGDLRTDHSRLEWRTPSGMWLIHPKLAEVVLGVTKCVSHEFFKVLENRDYDINSVKHYEDTGLTKKDQDRLVYAEPKQLSSDFSSWDRIEVVRDMGVCESNTKLKSILEEGKMKFTAQYLKDLKRRFKNLSVYREYAEHVDRFIEVLKAPEKEVTSERDLKKTWLEESKFVID